MNKLTQLIKSHSLETLKEIAIKLMTDTQDGSDMVMNSTMDELMERMPSDQFVSFCGELEEL